jgi:hypothetical protein
MRLISVEEADRSTKNLIVVDNEDSPAFDDSHPLCADLQGKFAGSTNPIEKQGTCQASGDSAKIRCPPFAARALLGRITPQFDASRTFVCMRALKFSEISYPIL